MSSLIILLGLLCPLYAADLPHTWGPYYSADKKFQITLAPFSASVSYVGQPATAIEVTLQDFHPDSDTKFNDPPIIEWSPNGHFFSVYGRTGAHGQYSFTSLFRIAEISAGSKHVFSVETVSLLSRLGELIPKPNPHSSWRQAGIKFSKEGIDARYTSHQPDDEADTIYVFHLQESAGRSLVLSSIESDTSDSRKTIFQK